MPVEVDRDAAAKEIAMWLGFSWDGLSEGSIEDKGLPCFTRGQFGWKFQGRKDDLRRLADKIRSN